MSPPLLQACSDARSISSAMWRCSLNFLSTASQTNSLIPRPSQGYFVFSSSLPQSCIREHFHMALCYMRTALKLAITSRHCLFFVVAPIFSRFYMLLRLYMPFYESMNLLVCMHAHFLAYDSCGGFGQHNPSSDVANFAK